MGTPSAPALCISGEDSPYGVGADSYNDGLITKQQATAQQAVLNLGPPPLWGGAPFPALHPLMLLRTRPALEALEDNTDMLIRLFIQYGGGPDGRVLFRDFIVLLRDYNIIGDPLPKKRPPRPVPTKSAEPEKTREPTAQEPPSPKKGLGGSASRCAWWIAGRTARRDCLDLSEAAAAFRCLRSTKLPVG